MSCCSCCGGRGCSVCNYIVNLPSEAPETLNFSNINLAGVGVLDSAVQPNINFRGIASANALLTAVLDAGNHTILLTVDSVAIAAALPAATTAQAGVLETATDAEAIAKAATDKIVVPSNFAAMASTLTFAGFVELATTAETQAGVDATRAVTPAGLASLTATQKFTTSFADAVARAGATADFAGQIGTQLDTDQPYVSYGVAAGQWYPLMVFNPNSPSVPNGATNGLQLGTSTLDISDGDISFTATDMTLDSLVLNLTSVDFQIGGTSITANRLLGSSPAPGDLAEYPISNFVSAYNTNAGWSGFSNSAVRKTGDCNTITLPELAQVVDTLINALKSTLKPAA